MRKQGTITSFFRPPSSASTNVATSEKTKDQHNRDESKKRLLTTGSSKLSSQPSSKSLAETTASGVPSSKRHKSTSAPSQSLSTTITGVTDPSIVSENASEPCSICPTSADSPAAQPSSFLDADKTPPPRYPGRRARRRVICDDEYDDDADDPTNKTGTQSKDVPPVDSMKVDKELSGKTAAAVSAAPKGPCADNVKPTSDDHVLENSEGEESDVEEDDIVLLSSKSSASKQLDISRLSTKRTWKDGAPVPYKFVAEAFTKVEEISGRLEIQAILTQLFRDIMVSTPQDLVPTIYLCINKLAPAHHGIELGIGESILLKALSQVTGQSVMTLKSTYKEVGDLGDVASNARTKQKTMFPPPPLTVRKVFSELKAIAMISGKNTQEAKLARIIKMMVASSKVEAKYIARALLGKLRIHLADKTVIAALAAAVTLEIEGYNTDVLLTVDGKKKSKMSKTEEAVEEVLKDAAIVLNRVYSQLPVWDIIVPKLLEFSRVDSRLEEACKLLPGVPVSPMLAKPTKAISEVLEKFSESAFTCEFKYDGERAQVHRLEDGSMKIYSRNAEDLTPKYPDLVRDLPKALQSEFKKASFIIDAEAVAYDIEKKKILPFQELQSRKRKDVNADEVKVKVCIFAFDLLFFNRESLIGETLQDRRQRLLAGFQEREGQFMFARGHDSRDPEQIMELLNDSVKAGCEGLMVKALEGTNSTYEPANRSQNWLKVKKDYLEGCGDSLDLVPIGGYIGRGKRTGIFGAFLLACYDPESEEYQSICKIGTGFTEADLENFSKYFKDDKEERISKNAKSYYRTSALEKLAPDVWFEPVQVWEVKCADLSVSPQHMAAVGQVDPEKGIALRFPRFIRVREDKKPDDATTSEQVAELYLRQSSVTNA